MQYFRWCWADGKSPLSPIPYSAVNSRVIPSLAYVTSKCRCRNMGRTRAIRIERCFWGTVDEQALVRAVFGDRGGEEASPFADFPSFCVECRWYIRMLPSSEKKATFMTHESRFSRLLIFHLHDESLQSFYQIWFTFMVNRSKRSKQNKKSSWCQNDSKMIIESHFSVSIYFNVILMLSWLVVLLGK